MTKSTSSIGSGPISLLLAIFLFVSGQAPKPPAFSPPDPKAPVRTVVAFEHLKFNQPVQITAAPGAGDALLVVERQGKIWRFENKAGVREKTLALDASKSIDSKQSEEGLLGLAVDPKFKENSRVFLYFTRYKPLRSILASYTMDAAGTTIDPASEKIILEIPQPYWNHNGGLPAFGPDGHLYLSLGDGGNQKDPHSNGQNLNLLLGKMLRIDVHNVPAGKSYGVPKDNPFVGREDARPEIYAFGLRNVWRYSFDRKTGEIWAADVGESAWEEVNIIKKGGNYGWSAREGGGAFVAERGKGPYEEPLYVYGRADGVSITGGHVYRGPTLAAIQGSYIFGDFQSGRVWSLTRGEKNEIKVMQIGNVLGLASFGEDKNGEILICSFDGRIYKVEAKDDLLPKPGIPAGK